MFEIHVLIIEAKELKRFSELIMLSDLYHQELSHIEWAGELVLG